MAKQKQEADSKDVQDLAGEPEVFDVYEDEDGNEYLLIDGKRVPFDPDRFDMVELDGEDAAEVDDEEFNLFLYDNVQAATDVANDLARDGASIMREGVALAGELKEAVDDISSLFNIKNWLK